MRIGKYRIRPRAFIISLVLIVILGGCMYEQTQRRAVETKAAAIQTEVKTNGICGKVSTGTGASIEGTTGARRTLGRSDKGTRPIQSESSEFIGTSTAAYKDKLSEYRGNEEVKETGSYSLLASRGDDRSYDRNTNNLFTTIGQEYKITAYTAGYESTGKRPGDKDYGITYSGKRLLDGHTIAADLTILPLGTKVIIEGLDNIYTVEDKGAAVKGKHIDLYIPKLKAAQNWGVQYRRIIILEMGAK